MLFSNKNDSDICFEIKGITGFISLNRPKAMNALSLPMVRRLMAQLLAWQDDAAVQQVAIRGMSKPAEDGTERPFGSFCAGGDIRFFHQAVLSGNPALEDFFTEEYTLNHLIANYPKPYIAFMDGIVFGGGMGIAQGASHRIVTERTKMAMPETGIGLFPDVGGGYFLSRCPGAVGEYLGLTGIAIGADEAIAYKLADCKFDSAQLPMVWKALETQLITQLDSYLENHKIAINNIAINDLNISVNDKLTTYFSLPTVSAMMQALEAHAVADSFEKQTLDILHGRSPLMLHVVLEQIRRGRHLDLAQNLKMERGMIRHCFHTAHLGRFGTASETVEGIRALVIDKDHRPQWQPTRVADVTDAMVQPFFDSPWPQHAHPLSHLNAVSKNGI